MVISKDPSQESRPRTLGSQEGGACVSAVSSAHIILVGFRRKIIGKNL